VYVAFDSDVATKPQVHASLARLKDFLESRRAKVELIYLPSADGEKVGLDDFFAASHSVEELLGYATGDLRAPDGASDVSLEYRASASGLFWSRPSRDGSIPVRLTNFTATIVADVLEDDGVEQKRLFEIEASLNGRTRRFLLPTPEFVAMRWECEQLGALAVVQGAPG
jgi:hypothetical protein